jgi:hypothetical protein
MFDNPLANLTRKRRENTQVIKIRYEKGNTTTNTNDIQRIMKEYFEKLYSNKLENLEEMDKILDAFELPKLNQKNKNYINIICTKQWDCNINRVSQ